MRTMTAAIAVLMLAACSSSDGTTDPTTPAATGTIASTTTTPAATTTTETAPTTTTSAPDRTLNRDTRLAWEQCSDEMISGLRYFDAVTEPNALEDAIDLCGAFSDQLSVDADGASQGDPILELNMNVSLFMYELTSANLDAVMGAWTEDDATTAAAAYRTVASEVAAQP
jgi:hypothetical protein